MVNASIAVLIIVAVVWVLYVLLRAVLLVFFFKCLGGRVGRDENDFDLEE